MAAVFLTSVHEHSLVRTYLQNRFFQGHIKYVEKFIDFATSRDFFSKRIAFRNTRKMPTKILFLQLGLPQFLHDTQYSDLIYFRNVDTWNKTVFFS